MLQGELFQLLSKVCVVLYCTCDVSVLCVLCMCGVLCTLFKACLCVYAAYSAIYVMPVHYVYCTCTYVSGVVCVYNCLVLLLQEAMLACASVSIHVHCIYMSGCVCTVAWQNVQKTQYYVCVNALRTCVCVGGWVYGWVGVSAFVCVCGWACLHLCGCAHALTVKLLEVSTSVSLSPCPITSVPLDLSQIKAYIDSFRYGAPPHAGGGIGKSHMHVS